MGLFNAPNMTTNPALANTGSSTQNNSNAKHPFDMLKTFAKQNSVNNTTFDAAKSPTMPSKVPVSPTKNV